MGGRAGQMVGGGGKPELAHRVGALASAASELRHWAAIRAARARDAGQVGDAR